MEIKCCTLSPKKVLAVKTKVKLTKIADDPYRENLTILSNFLIAKSSPANKIICISRLKTKTETTTDISNNLDFIMI